MLVASRAMVRRRSTARKKRSSFQQPVKRRGGAWVILVLGALVLVNLYVFVWDQKTGVRAIKQQAEAQTTPSLAVPSAPLEAPAPAPVAATPPAIVGKVAASDTLGRLLKKSGLTAAESDEIIRALSGVLDFKALRPGQTFRIERRADGRVQTFELEVSKSRHVRAERQPSGELTGTTIGS